jgi:hypothetical protein
MVLSDTHTFSPTLINNLRIGAMRQAFDFQAINAGKIGPLSWVCLVSARPVPQIDFGFGAIGGQVWHPRILELGHSDLVTKITGNHALKIGYNHRIAGSNRQGAALRVTTALAV